MYRPVNHSSGKAKFDAGGIGGDAMVERSGLES